MPPGEEMFKFHGYSGPCPKPPPLPKPSEMSEQAAFNVVWDDYAPDGIGARTNEPRQLFLDGWTHAIAWRNSIKLDSNNQIEPLEDNALDEIEEYLRDNALINNVWIADAIHALRRQVAQLREEAEQLRVQLAGCGVAAMGNTHSSIAHNTLPKDSYGWSASYEACLDSAKREVRERERAEKAERELLEMRKVFSEAGATFDVSYVRRLVGTERELAAARKEIESYKKAVEMLGDAVRAK